MKQAFLFALALFMALPAQADQKSALLKVSASIIQCGHQEDAYKACKTHEPRCCAVVRPETVAKLEMKNAPGGSEGFTAAQLAPQGFDPAIYE